MMRIILPLMMAAFLLVAGNSAPVFAQSQPKRFHTIAKGETLYRLTQIYKVSAKDICDANPGLSATNFKAGTVILIPPSQKSSSDTVAAVPRLRPQGIAGSDCREMHKTKRKETLYSIAQKYDITVAQLQKANPETLKPDFQLKKGYVLCIPFKEEIPVEVAKPEPTNEELFAAAKKTAKKLPVIKIGVLLPFSGSINSSKMVEYYRGMLMAVDELKQQGQSFEIRAFDIGPGQSASVILQKPELRETDIIFGPADSLQLSEIGLFAKNNGILAVSPFRRWSADAETNPYLFFLNPPTTTQANEALRLFKRQFGKSHVVLLETGRADELFASNLKKSAIPYGTFQLPSTEKGLLTHLAPDRHNVIVLSSSDLRSLNILMSLLQHVRRSHPSFSVSVFGYPKWQTYASSLDDLYAADTYIYTPFFLDNTSSAVKDFSQKYLSNFKEPMATGFPGMAPYGYDCARYLLTGMMRYGRSFSDQPNETQTLQHLFKFKRITNWGGLYNRNMQLIHYNKDHRIEKIYSTTEP